MKLKDYDVSPLLPSNPVSEVRISPGGGRILFTNTEVNVEEDKYDSHIWMYREGRIIQFTHSRCNDSTARWSPEGEMIIFLSNRLGEGDKKDAEPKNQLFIIPSDGGEARKLTYLDKAVQKPQWSPKEDSILFMSNVSRKEEREESDVKLIRRIKYKWDGKGFFQGEYTHLFTIPVDGGVPTQITEGGFDVDAASWSPEGDRIAFVTNLEENADITRFRSIYIIPAEREKAERIWKGEGSIKELSWSPDGKYIAFTGRIIEDPERIWYRNTEVFLLDLEGGEAGCLTDGLNRTVMGEPKWGRDSKYIYFRTPDQGTTRIWRTDLSGDREKLIDAPLNIDDFTVSHNGRIAFDATDSTTLHELYLMDDEGLNKLTHISNKLMAELPLSLPEEFRFTASDGAEIQGWIVRPLDYVEGEKYPVILEIHGGPHGVYGFKLEAAEHEFQVLAKHGFGVVYINPRGSVGYGEEFSRAVSGNWGERDYEDLMEALDYLLERNPWINGDKLGVAGGSFGGWMTNWILGHNNRFKAGVTMRCISNWYNLYGTSDIAYMDHEVNWGIEPWEDPGRLIEKSPIKYAANIEAPLLIIHSEQDYRCPMEQSEQLFTVLKKIEKETELIRFPEESHGLSRSGKPKHRIERLQHIIRWFDKHLKQ
jgi:dipeptidyl aminopeptidase/acylaminoacyl peptidase